MNVTLKDELIARGYGYNELVLSKIYKQFLSATGKLIIAKADCYDYPFISAAAKKISKDKTLSYEFATTHNISIPATVQTLDKAIARDFLMNYRRVVVKPPDMSGSRGLTVDIIDASKLDKALENATFNNQPPLVQEQFIGEEVRMTILAGKVQSVILRQTPRIIGDGVRSIALLIEKENEARQSLSFPLLAYPQLDHTLIDDRLLVDSSILAKGEVLELSRATMIKKGASFYGITNEIHNSYVAIAEQMAAPLSPSMLVVDFMIKDYTMPASPDNYIFLEFNTAPALEIYSSLRAGDCPDVIAKIADQVDMYATTCG